MKIYQGFANVSESFPNCVMTIGNFDGVHLGHVEIINRTLSKSKELGLPCGIYTFRPHPRAVLQPEAKIQFLTTYDEKLEQLAQYSPTFIVEEPFSRDFSTMTSQRFFEEVLVGRLHVSHLIVGHDFGFGKDRGGVLEKLRGYCTERNVGLEIVKPQSKDSIVVSSTKIRDLLAKHDVTEANRLLGYSFFYDGVVEKGAQRGEKIGYPTANFGIADKVELPKGVYATRSRVGGESYLSVTNIGIRPTFYDGSADLAQVVVENHIFDRSFKSQNIYGQQLRVSFEKFLRPEKKFNGVEELKKQIYDDVQSAELVLNK